MDFSFRTAARNELAEALQDARAQTLALFDCFARAGADAPQAMPPGAAFNPPLWELGHIAWFAESYVLREARSSEPAAAQRTSLLAKGDDWFDPNTVPFRARRSLDLPAGGPLKTYCREVLDRVLDKLERSAANDAALYPYRLALAYEDMRGEILMSMLQAFELELPRHAEVRSAQSRAAGEIAFPGGSVRMGSDDRDGFAFDNEKPAHRLRVPAFAMDAALVSNAEFAEFLDDGGYQNPQFWTAAAREWLMRQDRSLPRYWQRDGKRWRTERFGSRIALPADEPVRHVSLYEAQAYCSWAGRRLPEEREWEFAASSGHSAWRWGDLWEWTCTPFEPYPGFSPDAFREYSLPHFGSHQVLRGASFATRQRGRSPKCRHFLLPERDDAFTGFRTCAW